ncbi:MAG: transcriptional repressor [Actinobacteria bacterium]|nr:transcriptional repressor [Actinomycetota bacterium]
MSKSKTRILQALDSAGGFASAQEIHQLMTRSGERIGLTTTYRTLGKLLQEKIIDVMRREDGESVYRLCGESHHHHLVCKKCGKTIEIDGGSVEKWASEHALEHGFHDVSHSAEIYGTCQSCFKN